MPAVIGARIRGFTLMEALVTLVLVSLATMLIFQMLGNYRIARERTFEQSASIDTKVLFEAWFRESVRGLVAVEKGEFSGDASGFSGLSASGAFLATGAPRSIRWELQPDPEGGGGWRISYAEDGARRWSLPLKRTTRAWFEYLDASGSPQRQWPVALGDRATQLPGSIVLMRQDADGARAPLVASPAGVLNPVFRPFELEEE